MKIVNFHENVNVKRDVDSGTKEQQNSVLTIIKNVQEQGDQALLQYTKKHDGVDFQASELRVSEEEIKQAYHEVNSEAIEAIRLAIVNIRDYHERQVNQSWMTTKEDGTILGQKMTPLDSVGTYVPGGKAAYPSSILMNIIPAQIAGVKKIIMTSPPLSNGKLAAVVLVTANELGITDIYKVGGAQAIAALAYGTETIPKVDKITGPGNIYVALAKRAVFGTVDIDMIAGPSEIVILADEQANPRFIAADLLSQAEHDELASAVLVTPSEKLAKAVQEEVEEQLSRLPRKEIASQSIESYGRIYVVADILEGIHVVNQIAPEHLEVMTKDPLRLLGKIRHAGAIFLGEYSSEPVGDYFAGPNHILPTNGTARFSSPLSVEDFMKKSSVIFYTKEAFDHQAKHISTLARLEGLEAHARAIDIRLEEQS
ncbi:histidinol dehydrogenase [Alkalihalobacillus trypoxylicola]|uniref:Histidinol dehydrogenase n=1 Tax=Alkalihalobacillus trypoxylicola TaxID=519424 RepID=A0A162EUH2_9BACI|nr:histidinol dehydrogenase [Alkalihalobacillus trypoxylicola]KYG33754.1 histidinol dehydrogenase [Alkalihalobacillus trypoxylicola]